MVNLELESLGSYTKHRLPSTDGKHSLDRPIWSSFFLIAEWSYSPQTCYDTLCIENELVSRAMAYLARMALRPSRSLAKCTWKSQRIVPPGLKAITQRG